MKMAATGLLVAAFLYVCYMRWTAFRDLMNLAGLILACVVCWWLIAEADDARRETEMNTIAEGVRRGLKP